ncbi:thermonuclease family protein [bacterium]|nr:thermonuclease family protein [bacterium]MCI0566337.1 thermonuclease family protein [bacterium]MCI0680428.1 thermonuclease family protein [bacterium]
MNIMRTSGVFLLGFAIGFALSVFLVQNENGAGKSEEIVSAAVINTPTDENFAAGEQDRNKTFFLVVKVIDGDTIAVSMNGSTETVRLIGIDTPEVPGSKAKVECLGREASEKMSELLAQESVRLEKDATQGDRDRYGRLLAYVFREDGLFMNKWMIEEGYAYEYTYAAPYAYQREFKEAEKKAREEKRGLWAVNICGKETKNREEATTIPAGPYPDDCISNIYNCTDFTTQAEAQNIYDSCGGAGNDIHKLDQNKDGEACESLP